MRRRAVFVFGLAALAGLAGALVLAHARTCDDADCCWSNFTSALDDCGDRYGPPGEGEPPEDPDRKEVRMAQLRACLQGAVDELGIFLDAVHERRVLNDGAPLFTKGTLESPEVYSFEVYVPAGGEGTWRLEIANGLHEYPGAGPGLLARVTGSLEVNGERVLDESTWSGESHRISRQVTLVQGINTLTFEVYQADGSEFGLFFPLLYR